MATATKRKARKRGSAAANGQSHSARNGKKHVPGKIAVNVLEDRDPDLPQLPEVDERGNYPAIESARIIIARQIIRGRKAAGWTQAELAARAGVRQETVSRLETGKHSVGAKTMAKLDKALRSAGV